MPNLTDNPLLVAESIIDFLSDNKTSLGLRTIVYGEDEFVTETPTVEVVPGTMTTETVETAFTVRNNFPVHITIIHSRLDNRQVTRKECDSFAYNVRNKLHENPKLGGLVVFGYVTMVEPGFTTRQRALMRATRLTWSGFSKTKLV